ncbi:MAG: DUF4288 domain-containing protein [Anaerolineae bacterium]|jgi:hypothetical protein|nr:DUF4288 domain-containing protein [Anaerolineae bacterium]
MSSRAWYLAEIVEAFENTSTKERWAYVNMILISADNPESAYRKSVKMGEMSNDSYVNNNEERVIVNFAGLRNIYKIHEDLEDGAEILYELHEGMTDEGIKILTKKKEELSIFKPRNKDND